MAKGGIEREKQREKREQRGERYEREKEAVWWKQKQPSQGQI